MGTKERTQGNKTLELMEGLNGKTGTGKILRTGQESSTQGMSKNEGILDGRDTQSKSDQGIMLDRIARMTEKTRKSCTIKTKDRKAFMEIITNKLQTVGICGRSK